MQRSKAYHCGEQNVRDHRLTPHYCSERKNIQNHLEFLNLRFEKAKKQLFAHVCFRTKMDVKAAEKLKEEHEINSAALNSALSNFVLEEPQLSVSPGADWSSVDAGKVVLSDDEADEISDRHVEEDEEERKRKSENKQNHTFNGEENENKLCDLNVRFYVYAIKNGGVSAAESVEAKEWKNIGGPSYIRILEDKTTKKRRIVIRMRFTGRVVLNSPLSGVAGSLKEAGADSDKDTIGSLTDEAETDNEDLFCIVDSVFAFVFQTKSDCDRFKTLWNT
jgi:hypothetical protein